MCSDEKIDIYIMDTSSFIELKKSYPKNIFKSIWKELEFLIKNGRLITHEFVIKELEKQDDEISQWVKSLKTKYKDFVHKTDIVQINKLQHIVNRFPAILQIREKYEKPYHADPFIIALALEIKEA